jgi:hypothetical protein
MLHSSDSVVFLWYVPGEHVIQSLLTFLERWFPAVSWFLGCCCCCCSCDDILATSSSDSEDTGAEASNDSEAEYAEHQPVLVGAAHQAELPQLRPRPAHPTAAEAKFLTAAVHTPAAWQQQAQQQQEQASPWLALPPGQFHAQWVAAGSGAARLQLLQHWLQRMDEAMGQGMAEVRPRSRV